MSFEKCVDWFVGVAWSKGVANPDVKERSLACSPKTNRGHVHTSLVSLLNTIDVVKFTLHRKKLLLNLNALGK